MPRRRLAYWIATALFCGLFALGGAGHLARAAWVAEGMQRLGYPPYVMTLLGVAKLLGVAALLAPRRPLLKEWAYAGFAFDLLGAAASHAFVGDFSQTWRPAFVLVLGIASYLLRPAERRLPQTPALPVGPPA